MPILTHPATGGRFEVQTDEQVRYWARSGWVVDADQSPVDAAPVPEPVAPADAAPSTPDPEPAAPATRTSKKEK